ncbi:helix-turn-helix domain-containing protein [Pseudomonas sp. LY10J]|uniref:helix-turn-helix domain-containing protein n=1 Tax=Pseudomonas TaxID=286 RepID=UPI001E5E2C4D|nr:LysR family transcriptional regulator [Pseudomonas quercus]
MVSRTRSAVSMQMKQLEKEALQRQLFERGTAMRWTPEARVIAWPTPAQAWLPSWRW